MENDDKKPLTAGGPPPSYGDAPTDVPPTYSETAASAPPPQAQGPPPQAPVTNTTTTTVITQPVVVQQNLKLGEYPVTVICPTGGHQITTEIRYESGTLTWVIAVVLCLIVGICFAWIPFIINDLKDVVHVCPIDGSVVGVYKRM